MLLDSTQDGPTPGPAPGEKGLKRDTVGLLASIALGLSLVAPAYSIAVTLGWVTLVVGDLAPAALLFGFVPIVLTAFAFRELNRELPDCGTNFVWTTRAFGPFAGWLSGGWVPQIATLIAMTALSQVGALYLLSFLGLDSLAENSVAVTATALLLTAVVTAVARRGLTLATSVQYALLALQLIALIGFGIAAFADDSAAAPSLEWLNPAGFDGLSPFVEGVLLCLFIYWGWDGLLTVNEETQDSSRTPGKAAVISTVILLATYLFTAFAAISFAGTGGTGLGLGNEENAGDVLASLAPSALGAAPAKVVELAVCVSALSALLTSIMGSSRSTLSMATHGALPKAFTKIHPRYRTPAFSTLAAGTATGVLLVLLTLASADFLGDAVLSIGLLIACYYGTTALSCVWYFRKRLRDSPRDLFLRGILPLLGGLMMLAAFVRSAYDMYAADYGYTSFRGIGGVFLLGVGSIVVGAVVMLAVRPSFRRFFREGRTAVAELTVTED